MCVCTARNDALFPIMILIAFLVLLLLVVPQVESGPIQHQTVFGGNVEAYVNPKTSVPVVIEQALAAGAQITTAATTTTTTTTNYAVQIKALIKTVEQRDKNN